jgi:hypothetical protein
MGTRIIIVGKGMVRPLSLICNTKLNISENDVMIPILEKLKTIRLSEEVRVFLNFIENIELMLSNHQRDIYHIGDYG